MPILHNIKDHSSKLKNDFIQQDVLNFYDKDTVVPYSPVSAKGPWIVDKNGSVIYDVGGYGMLGFSHCPEWALTTLAKPHVMANIMTPNNIQLEFTELLKNKIGMNRPDKKCPYSKFAFLNSGSEGMEFALRVNDINHEKNMKPPAFIVLKSGFHGRTTSASLISDSTKKTYQKHMKSYDTSDSVFPVVVNNLQHLQDMFFSLKNGGYD